MPRPTYGEPIWLATRPKAKRPTFNQLPGELDVPDVAIVGGGLTGMMTAASFARAGHKVVVLEAERVGAGATASAIGIIAPTPGVAFGNLRARHGLRAAREVWDASRRAALECAAALRRWGIRCDLADVDYLTLAMSPADADSLEGEHAALREAGLEASWLPAARARAASGVDAYGALKLAGASVVDPYALVTGLAREAARAGAFIAERTKVTRVKPGRKRAEVVTSHGVVPAHTAIVATSTAAAGLGALARHLRIAEATAVALPAMTDAALRHAGLRTATAMAEAGNHPHQWRLARGGVVVACGVEQPPVASRLRDKALVQRGGQLMYEMSLRYPAISGVHPTDTWSVPVARGRDGLMWVGPHRNFPRHLMALGLGGAGVAGAWLAARILLRKFEEQDEAADDYFGFGR